MARLSLAEVGLLLLLALALMLGAEAGEKRQRTLRRKKREWIIPPAKLEENVDYTNKKYIAKIRSDKDINSTVAYHLSGEGADKEPFRLFVVDAVTGFVRITGILDREKKAVYDLTGKAKYLDGSLAETDIPLKVIVLDQNDNTPSFELQSGNITEASKKGSYIMQIVGKDDDQAGTPNSEISYSIVSQHPAGKGQMFSMDSKTGKLYVMENTLDRETCDSYTLVVQGADLGGAAGGRTGTGTVVIKVLDINDNPPTLEKTAYTVSVNENVAGVVLMRLKALDKDLEYTDNWEAVFKIITGNENNFFSIETDKKTNEGVLKLIKPLDFEELQKLKLGLVIENVAALVNSGHGEMNVDVSNQTQNATLESYSILISVNNVLEAPAFKPETTVVSVSEDPKNMPVDGVVTTFTAIDPDTGLQAKDVSYAKAYDPDNWFTIDEETAEIKLNKVPDRESPFLEKGTYIAKILAITKDMPAKTTTGTISVQVTDSNDQCPTLTTTSTSVCANSKTVYVTGIDKDVSPNAAPFSFKIVPDGTRGSWDVEVINETSAALHSHEMLWPGTYELQVEVADAQGLSCPENEVFKVDVCTCEDTGDCSTRTSKLAAPSTELSAAAIGLLISAICLLLLIPLLLLFCQCGGANTIFPDKFSDIPFDAKEHLISYHTEGKGEDKEVPLQSVPILLEDQKKVWAAPALNLNGMASEITKTHQSSAFYEQSLQKFQENRQSLMEFDNAYGFSRQSFNNNSAGYSRQTVLRTTALYDEIALPDAFLNEYYSQKADCTVPVKDDLLRYDFEGQGSPAGSMGCCSLLDSDDDLQFLSDLGPKFKTLAEICSPPTPTTETLLTHQIAGAVKTTVDIVEPIVKPKIEPTVKTTHTDIKAERVMSSTNISKSVSTVNTAAQSVTLPRSNVTNISQSATLPRPAQTVILQQQPVYYTTSPVLQPLHYVVQPQLQNTVLLANGASGANLPGYYVVSRPQSPPSGLVISGTSHPPSALVIQGTESPQSPVSPASPGSPTLLLSGSPGVFPGSVPTEGWKIAGPNPDGTYVLVKDNSSPAEAEGVDPGSSQGTLPRGATLVKEAAPPQGVLGPAAQGSAFGIQPGHTVVKREGVFAVGSNLGKTQVREPGQMGLGPEVRHTGIHPSGMNPVGIRQVHESQQIWPLEQAGDPTKDETVPDQLTKIPESQTTTSSDVISQSTESNDPQQNTEEGAMGVHSKEQENLVPSEGFSMEDKPVLTQMTSTEAVQLESDVSDLVNTDKENEETSAFPQGEGATSTVDHINIVEDQIHDSTKENLGSQEAAPLEDEEVEEEGKSVHLSTVAGPEDGSSESQSDEVKEDQSDRDQEEDVSLADEVVSDLEANQVIDASDGINAEENIEEITIVTSDSYEEVKAEQDQPLESEVGLGAMDAQLSASPSNEISTETLNTSDERSIPDQEAMPELQMDHSEEIKIDEGHAKTDVVDAEAITPLQTVSTTLANQEEKDLNDSNLISASEEITTEVQEEGPNVPTITTSDQHQLIAEDDDNQQDIMLESDKDQVSAEAGSMSDGEKEESIVEEGVSQQSFSTSDDQDEDIERQDALSTSSQMEENFISDDNISDIEKDEDDVEEMVSKEEQNISSSDSQDGESANKEASSTRSQVDDNLMPDDNINGPEKEEEETLEKVALSTQQNFSIRDNQDEESEEEAVSGRNSSLEDQLVTDDDINIGEEEDHTVEKATSYIQPHLSISNDQDEEIVKEDAGGVTSQVEEKLTSERDGVKEEGSVEEEVSPVHQKTFISADDSEKDASHTVSQVEEKLISDETVCEGQKEEKNTSSLERHISISSDQNGESGREDAHHTSSQVDGEAFKSYQPSEEGYQSLDTESLSAMSKVAETQEMPCEVTTQQVRQGIESSQTGDITLDIPERQALVRGANMEGLDEVITSSEELGSSRVATGQVSMSSEDKGASGRILASGKIAGGDLTLEEGKAEATFDPEIREGLGSGASNASGQVSPTSYSEIKVVDKAISSKLETDLGSAETGTATFIATSEVGEEAGDLVQDENVHITGEEAEVDPNTEGKAGLIEVVSNASDNMYVAEASGGEVSPVQTVIGQTPRNKFRWSKKDSNKNPRSPKSPSGKCKQQ
ncbi:uncharacterized protein LOC121941115 [Plectropomus leopardus]|uniref:uncharacterized protein LOC121941115 n=1 Tax=Plectropomus leopardus TaxID=160734 RepID=UPI001C4C62F6|nr:uncharacterized protein LOC121941115 [Plectropomus leopardus]